jgi:glycerophosphoryl diester phosphodiesterase
MLEANRGHGPDRKQSKSYGKSRPLVGSPLFLSGQRTRRKEDAWLYDRPIAHRGLHNIHDGVLEHSRVSIVRAMDAGLPIELDFVASREMTNFVFHDFILDRLTNGAGEIACLSNEEIRSCTMHGTVREPIMTFGELLDLVNGKVPLVIEFKHRDPNPCPSVEAACSALVRYDGKFAVQSFNPFIIEYLNDAFPQFTTGLLTSQFDELQHRQKYILAMMGGRVRPHFIGQHIKKLNSWTFQWVLETGLPIIPFVVRNNCEWESVKSFASNMYF